MKHPRSIIRWLSQEFVSRCCLENPKVLNINGFQDMRTRLIVPKPLLPLERRRTSLIDTSRISRVPGQFNNSTLILLANICHLRALRLIHSSHAARPRGHPRGGHVARPPRRVLRGRGRVRLGRARALLLLRAPALVVARGRGRVGAPGRRASAPGAVLLRARAGSHVPGAWGVRTDRLGRAVPQDAGQYGKSDEIISIRKLFRYPFLYLDRD